MDVNWWGANKISIETWNWANSTSCVIRPQEIGRYEDSSNCRVILTQKLCLLRTIVVKHDFCGTFNNDHFVVGATLFLRCCKAEAKSLRCEPRDLRAAG